MNKIAEMEVDTNEVEEVVVEKETELAKVIKSAKSVKKVVDGMVDKVIPSVLKQSKIVEDVIVEGVETVVDAGKAVEVQIRKIVPLGNRNR